MEALIERCCGLDVHQAQVVGCVLLGPATDAPSKEVRRFGTLPQDLRALSEWLHGHGCTHVAMESTGVYWMPIYRALEGQFTLVVGNAKHLAKVPGRKTDVLDSEWIADLMRHGLIQPSFVPPPPIRELRDLTRYRRQLVQSRSTERNRLLRLLEIAHIKLASVMSDVFGVSGMAMLRALVAGQRDARHIAELAKSRLRSKIDVLTAALESGIDEHHRDLLRIQLARLDELEGHIAAVERRIEEKLRPYEEQRARLTQIPGVERVVAAGLLAELGADMSVFANAAACASWAGVCPGNNESAGKRKSSRTRPGNPYLKTLLVEAAQAAAKTKGTYLHNKFYRIKARRGHKRAIMAIAHKILIAAYHILATGQDYRELGAGYLDSLDQKRAARTLVHRLERLGYRVTLETPAQEPGAASPSLPASPQQATRPCASTSPPRAPTAASAPPDDVVAAATTVPAPAIAAAVAHAPQAMPVTAHAFVAAPSRPARPAARARKPRDVRLPPVGTTMTRYYQGVAHHVLVLDDGFAYQGQWYPSLSGLAKQITGTPWNGFRFFHLKRPPPA